MLRRVRRWAEWRLTGSCAVRDDRLRAEFLEDPGNTVLVSYPRTGSHMVRLVAELYFGRPLLPRTFYHPCREDYLLLHAHDRELDLEHPTVVYLHRDPVDTVFSEIRYREGSARDVSLVAEVASEYARHLEKWLLAEAFTAKKTVLTYELMRRQPVEAVRRLCDHFGRRLDPDRAERAWSRVTRAEVGRRTGHDPRVVRSPERRAEYRESREAFRERFGSRVRGLLEQVDARLGSAFDGATGDDCGR